MRPQAAEPFAVEVAPSADVTALLYPAAAASLGTTLVLGHGAGAPQTSAFMVGYARALAARGLDVVTFNFLYTEQRRRVPDPPHLLESSFRAVVAAARAREPLAANRLVIGGKSMGGRIATHVAAERDATANAVAGLVLLGYPLHPPGKPTQLRTAHLQRVRVPMLFVQGAADAFGSSRELKPLLAALHPLSALHVVPGGDHSFKVARSGHVSQDAVHAAVQDEIARWIRTLPAT